MNFMLTLGYAKRDILSPTMFTVFINDLPISLRDLDLGIEIGDRKNPILLYADDVLLLMMRGECRNCYSLLTIGLTNWCGRWQMAINMVKSNIMHFRPKSVTRCIRPLYLLFNTQGGGIYKDL